MKKAVIIGSGPAGISAALYLQRSGKIDVSIISNGMGALGKAEKIENYYGFAEPVSGEELYKRGVEGAKRLGVEFIEEEVVSVVFDDNYMPVAVTNKGEYTADALLLATGISRKTLNIKGIKEFEGKGVSYCAVCDAFFYRGKNVCVIGSGEYAVHEAQVLANTSPKVTLLTNGVELTAELPENIKLNTNKIAEVKGDLTVEGVEFEDGSSIEVNGVFIALGTADSGDLARKVGAVIDNGHIMVNNKMETTIPGLFAAGDCTGGTLQVFKAVYEGATAGLAIINYLKNKPE